MGSADMDGITSRKLRMFSHKGSKSASAYKKIGMETGVDQANARSDVAALDDVMHVVEPIANGWKQIGNEMTPRLIAA